MNAVEARGLVYRYGKHQVLDDLDLTIPEGAFYALLGRNGTGKTTLMQLLLGIRRRQGGAVTLFARDSTRLSMEERANVGYVAEGQELPEWMRLEQLEAYLAPLYPRWDKAFVRTLQNRFALDPKRKVRELSRGERMKVALLCALAPRPRLLVMDEPFTGMDVMIKDELVRGLLDLAGQEGATVVLCSHDIGELEMLADWIGVMRYGRMQLSESMEQARARFKRVEIVGATPTPLLTTYGSEWLDVEHSGHRTSFIVSNAKTTLEREMAAQFPHAERIEVRDASMREIFVAVSRAGLANVNHTAEAAA